MADNPDGASANIAREVVERDRAEVMRLWPGQCGPWRVVFTCDALPAIRLVKHLVDAGRVIVRILLSAAIRTAV